MDRRRAEIRVEGVVQGVGFRPYVYGLAAQLRLAGFVANGSEGVWIEVEGGATDVSAFADRLREAPPPLARIDEIAERDVAPTGETAFRIRESASEGRRTVLVPADAATCPACLAELHDPDDRRYRYPFINCTHCGPRYTIIREMPYDRASTTMAAFAMCDACRAEYGDPANRRFHAEPTCCPACGPRARLADAATGEARAQGDAAVRAVVDALAGGAIAAIKGLGGCHLACDARNGEAVAALRRRKQRDLKPFAVMTADLASAGRIACVDAVAAELLTGRERPIVLLEKRPGHGLAEGVAPRSASFGVMLPYTPLHHLLFDGRCDALVMTSGNVSDEPIAHTNADALARLAGIADVMLLHDRDIHIRTDDSVVRPILGVGTLLRRSRGYAPLPVELGFDTTGREILATGPYLSNTVCLTREGKAYLSHHIGDLENEPAYESFVQAIGHLQSVLGVTPAAVAHDLHPTYLSTRFAMESGLPLIGVQHHHAHVAATLAEHGRTDRVIGVAFDGIGWGDVGARAWGGEFLIADLESSERAGHLAPVPQPGGDAAARSPLRMALAWLRAAYGDEEAAERAAALLPGLDERERGTLLRMMGRGVNSPATTSMGRLFDAAAALLGVCDWNSYHAQAPVELEAIAASAGEERTAYPMAVTASTDGAGWQLEADALIRGLAEDRMGGVSADRLAARFHESIARGVVDMCERIRDNAGLSTVVLSGGVFANAVLLERMVPLLSEAGFEALRSVRVPSGDGGIALGQAAIASRRLSCA